MPEIRNDPFPIGFRRGWTDWQRNLPGVVRWAKENHFAHMDFGPITPAEARQVLDAGLPIGSVDLQSWQDLVSPDSARRNAALQANARYVSEMTSLGVRLFLAVVSPSEPQRPRQENFEFAVDGYTALCESIRSTGAKVILEGAPGKPPY